MSDRRKYLLLVGAIAAALVGALLIALPSSPVQKKPTLGLDLRGGLEVVLKAVPPKGHTLTPDDMSRSISIMQNRINKLRRVRAGDPQAGQQPDRDPARRRPRSGGRRGADREDRAAHALRLRERPDRAVARRQRQPDRDAHALLAAHLGEEAGREGDAERVLPLQDDDDHQAGEDEERQADREADGHDEALARRRPGRLEGEAAPSVRRQGADGPRDSRGAGEHAGRQLPDRERLPRRPPGPDLADRDVLLPPQVLPDARLEPGAGDERLRPRPLRYEGGLRPGREPDRDAPVHEPRLESVPEDHAPGGAARPGALQPRRQAG